MLKPTIECDSYNINKGLPLYVRLEMHCAHPHTVSAQRCYIPYSRKVWRAECLVNLLILSVWRKKVWRMNGSAKGLSMVGINLDGFSLANRLRFAKFAKLSPRQTFLLYGISYTMCIHGLPNICTSTLGPAALVLWVHISGKPLMPMV